MGSPCFCDWTEYNEAAGALCSCCHNNCEPCCGEPCNFLEGCYCFLCWWCCGPCLTCKWWASQLDQPCALINHVLVGCCMMFCGFSWLFNCLVRYNGRMEAGVTENPDSIDKYLGDCFLPCCCLTSPCALCQQLRAVPKSHWDCLDMEAHGCCSVCVGDLRIITPPPGGNKMN